MNLQKIEELIGKYERAETTVEEEKFLAEFFKYEKIPAHLQGYKQVFSAFSRMAEEEQLAPEFDEKILALISDKKAIPFNPYRKLINISLAVAASVLILIGIYSRFWIMTSPENETYSDPKLAYAETKRVLLKVSATLNSGMKEMTKIAEFNDGLSELNKITVFETGLDHVKKIAILDDIKEIITSKNNLK
jgi:hypothetical protein